MCLCFFGFLQCAANSCSADQDTEHPQNARFIIDRGTVLDTKTNLRWQRCSVGLLWIENHQCVGKIKKFTFKEARKLKDEVISQEVWRVPTKPELESLLQKPKNGFAINRSIFPDVNEVNHLYWTIDMHDPESPWAIDFNYGNVSYFFGDYSIIDNKWSVRLVRANQNEISMILAK